MSYPTISPISSSSTLVVSPLPLDHHLNGEPTKKPVLKLVTDWSFPQLEVGKRMSGKGFIEPHRNNLPRRKRKVVAAPRDIAHEIDNTSSQTRADVDADSDLMTNSESQSMGGGQSICAQELSKGIFLGFLVEGVEPDENIIRIKVCDDSIDPLSTHLSPSLSLAPTSSSSSVPYLQLSLPANPLSYIDGTTTLTDSQIQEACAFIDEHLSLPPADTNDTLRPARVSVLILAPRNRPEEAMTIGVSYLAGIENLEKSIGEMKRDEATDDHDDSFDDYTYSTVHRLLMAFHDDPGSAILEAKELETPGHHLTSEKPTSRSSCINLTPSGCGLDTGSLRGLRPEWRGVLSFDGMQRLEKVWTSPFRRI